MAYFTDKGTCPCGSGRPFIQCCLIKEIKQGSPLKEIHEYIESALGKGILSSDAEIDAELAGIMEARNTAAVDDFSGLSPEHMSRFLYFPFESNHLIEFSLDTKNFTESPFIKLFLFLIQGCNEGNGVKGTARGNLPRNLCRDAALEYYGEELNKEHLKYFKITTEMDFMELHTVRIVAGIAGYIKKVRGKFMLTKKGKIIAQKGMDGKTVIDLLKAYTRKFNWGYNDGFSELPIVQNSFLYTLFVLRKYGGILRPSSFYGDLFIKAFPDAMNEVSETTFFPKEEEVKMCYAVRCLNRFACFWGFAQGEKTQNDYTGKNFELKKTLFLDQLVSFNIGKS